MRNKQRYSWTSRKLRLARTDSEDDTFMGQTRCEDEDVKDRLSMKMVDHEDQFAAAFCIVFGLSPMPHFGEHRVLVVVNTDQVLGVRYGPRRRCVGDHHRTGCHCIEVLVCSPDRGTDRCHDTVCGVLHHPRSHPCPNFSDTCFVAMAFPILRGESRSQWSVWPALVWEWGCWWCIMGIRSLM
jgi:hypothetical protein